MTSCFEFIIEKSNSFFFIEKKKKNENNKILRENKKQVITHHSSLLIYHFVNIDIYTFLSKSQSILVTKTYNKSVFFLFKAKVMSDE